MPYTTLAWGLPFVGLLLTIAAAPLALPGIGGRHYGKLAAFWALAFVAPDLLHEGAGAADGALDLECTIPVKVVAIRTAAVAASVGGGAWALRGMGNSGCARFSS